MSVDVSIFAADIPAGTYSAGDTIQLTNVKGPAVVRSGRGAALLKRITTILITDQSGSYSLWKIRVKNSDWIDPATSYAGFVGDGTTLDKRTGAVSAGHDCPLTPNSSWDVVAECTGSFTTTVANSVAAVIEIDYPNVAAITDPDKLVGIPCSIEHEQAAVNVNAPGTLTSSAWDVVNVDFFKAGYVYALEKLELNSVATGVTGFVGISNAAGMGGLTRLIPITNGVDKIRPLIEYASSLQKGPLDIMFCLFNNKAATATTDTIDVVFDFVKRKL